MLSPEEIQSALAPGYELRGLEIKGPGPRTDSHLFAKVTRALLGLGNRRDGGYVLIGIDDTDPAALLPGLSADDLATWLDYDSIGRKLAEYADPALRFDVVGIGLASGASIAAIQVFEFEDIPHICKKIYDNPGGGSPVLRAGALYVRPRKVPETSEVASSVEMREVIDLATQKALRAYVETAARAGVALTSASPVLGGPSDDEKFAAERAGAWG